MTRDRPTSDIAFSDAVKAAQSARGSRRTYERIEERGGFRTGVTAELADFLAQIDTAYLATANLAGQPYAQHRGGPKGFIRVIDDTTVGFADYSGNRQYITTGNLSENDRAFLFLMDYARQRRIKLWGHARVLADPAVVEELMPRGYAARGEQAILFRVDAWDVNCPQHIPAKFDAADVVRVVDDLEAKLDQARAEVERLRAELAARS